MKPNIDRNGRLLRAASGTICILFGAAIWLIGWPESTGLRTVVSVASGLIGAFQWFEARKSWCIVRACGIRTPL
jgi:hypothetical protein